MGSCVMVGAGGVSGVDEEDYKDIEIHRSDLPFKEMPDEVKNIVYDAIPKYHEPLEVHLLSLPGGGSDFLFLDMGPERVWNRLLMIANYRRGLYESYGLSYDTAGYSDTYTYYSLTESFDTRLLLWENPSKPGYTDFQLGREFEISPGDIAYIVDGNETFSFRLLTASASENTARCAFYYGQKPVQNDYYDKLGSMQRREFLIGDNSLNGQSVNYLFGYSIKLVSMTKNPLSDTGDNDKAVFLIEPDTETDTMKFDGTPFRIREMEYLDTGDFSLNCQRIDISECLDEDEACIGEGRVETLLTFIKRPSLHEDVTLYNTSTRFSRVKVNDYWISLVAAFPEPGKGYGHSEKYLLLSIEPD